MLHATLPARILLHLRIAVVKDDDDVIGSIPPSMFGHSQGGQRSTNIVGVDTWLPRPSPSSRRDDYELE